MSTHKKTTKSAAEESILVTTAGTIVGQGIIKCLKLANGGNSSSIKKYRIVGSDLSPDAAALYRSDVGYLVPPFSSKEEYISSIIEICKEEEVRAVFIGADEELIFLAGEARRIQKEGNGALVISSQEEVISRCVDKWKTFQFLKQHGFPCPQSALPQENGKLRHSEFEKLNYPLIIKPRGGHGSLQVFIVKNELEAKSAISSIKQAGWEPMIQELISGEEFTVGVTLDREGKSIMSSIAMRRSLKSGQTYRAFIDADYSEVRKTCEEVALKLGARGPLNLQGRLSNGEFKIFEINPRFSASCPMRAAAGVNEPDIVFTNFIRRKNIRSIESHKRLVCMRYWNELYVPYSIYERLKKERKIKKENSVSELKDYF